MFRVGRVSCNREVETVHQLHRRELLAHLARGHPVTLGDFILDEATANLDMESEALVLDAILDLAVGRTVIMIAHRLAMAERADQIVVLQAGRGAECGTPAALRDSGGLYAAMRSAGREEAEDLSCAI